MAVNRVGRSSRIEQTSPHSSTVNIDAYYIFQEKHDFSELPFTKDVVDDTLETETLKQILYILLRDIVLDGCSIISRGALTKGNQRVEASFKPPITIKQLPLMYLPLPGISDPIKPIDHTILSQRDRVLKEISTATEILTKNLNNANLIKLIVLISHEYGHFISYNNGNHDKELKVGLSLLHTESTFINSADRYAYQIFNEEVTAWRLAENKLNRIKNFTWWDIFKQIKHNSLKFYYQRLNLEQSSIDVYCKLSMLGVDLANLTAK